MKINFKANSNVDVNNVEVVVMDFEVPAEYSAEEIQEIIKDTRNEEISVEEIFHLSVQGYIGPGPSFKDKMPEDFPTSRLFNEYDILGVRMYLEVRQLLQGFGFWNRLPGIGRMFGAINAVVADYASDNVPRRNIADFIKGFSCCCKFEKGEGIDIQPLVSQLMLASVALLDMFVFDWATVEDLSACIAFIRKTIKSFPNGDKILANKKLFYDRRQYNNISHPPVNGAVTKKLPGAQALEKGMNKSDLLRAYCEFTYTFDDSSGYLSKRLVELLPSISKRLGINLKDISENDIYGAAYPKNKVFNLFG